MDAPHEIGRDLMITRLSQVNWQPADVIRKSYGLEALAVTEPELARMLSQTGLPNCTGHLGEKRLSCSLGFTANWVVCASFPSSNWSGR
jgi:hypothetical protein